MRYDRDIRRRGPRSRADNWTADWPEEFEWGGGYIGGRGYGGTNYDLEHGYATGGWSLRARPPRGAPPGEGRAEPFTPVIRGGYARGEADPGDEYGPGRYGYGPYFDRLRRRRRSDDDLRQEVEDTLFYDTWVDADAIAVSVEDGVVRLRGTLPSYDELRYAVDDAWNVDGVRGVRSEMEVREAGIGDPSGVPPERYELGAPHMHGHPTAGGLAPLANPTPSPGPAPMADASTDRGAAARRSEESRTGAGDGNSGPAGPGR